MVGLCTLIPAQDSLSVKQTQQATQKNLPWNLGRSSILYDVTSYSVNAWRCCDQQVWMCFWYRKKVRIFDEFKAPFPPFFSLKTGEMFNVSGAVLLMGMFYLRRKWSIGFAGNCSHPLGSAGISLYAQGQLGGDVTEFGVTLRGWTKSKLMIFYSLCLFRRV